MTRPARSAPLPLLDGVQGGATLSVDKVYRYLLNRDWFPKDRARGNVLWIMLNPSTADGDTDDRTLRKIQKFTRAWGHDGLSVVNLFALRTRNPARLYHHPDPVGPMNDEIIRAMLESPSFPRIVAAWGAHGSFAHRGDEVRQLVATCGRTLEVLTITKDGHPGHPLYLPDDTAPRPWSD